MFQVSHLHLNHITGLQIQYLLFYLFSFRLLRRCISFPSINECNDVKGSTEVFEIVYYLRQSTFKDDVGNNGSSEGGIRWKPQLSWWGVEASDILFCDREDVLLKLFYIRKKGLYGI